MSDPTTHNVLQSLRPKNAEELAFWWGLVAPMVVLVVGFKLWRIFERGEVGSWWVAPDLVRSDLFVVAAFASLGLAGLRALTGRLGRMAWFGALQISAAIWGALEVIANHFFAVTGSTFDLHLLIFSVGRIDETFDVVTSEVSMVSWALLGAVVVLLILLPWGLRAWAAQSDDWPGQSGRPMREFQVALAVGVGCVLFSVLPPMGEDYSAFGRANLVNMVLSLQDVRVTGEIEESIERRALDGLRLVEADDRQVNPKNVAIIILESTRAQSMTVYDKSMETTPFLGELATQSTVADRAYAVVPHTSKALVAILCGLEPRLRMPITEALPGGLPARCLPDLLGDMGYASVFLQSATERFEDRPGLVDNMGFEDFIPLESMERAGYEEANYFGREDAVMLPQSYEWLADRGDEPFVATYLTLTPHHDYLAPKQRYGRFEFVADDDELNRYKNTLYYVDQFTKELFEQYRQLGLYDDTLFVIVGDHGEAFGEHGRTQHDNVMWEEGIHVPLMIYDPSRPEGKRLQSPVSHIDLAPTIVDWLGFDVDGGQYPGMPIGESDADRVVFSHCWYERRCMARTGQKLKYIDHFGQRGAEVYDVEKDPREQHNLAGEKKDEIRNWRAEVYGWRQAVNNLYQREQSGRIEEFVLDELPDGVMETDFSIGDFARYRGYELDADSIRRGQRVTITHYFEVLGPIPGGWKLFVHGENDASMLNLDHVPVDGMHPVDEWEPGTIVADEHSFRVPRDWEPGDFRLYLGIWHNDQGRAPIVGDVTTDGDRRALVFERRLQ